MYSAVLGAHSWVRWAVVLFGLFAVVRGVTGWLRRGSWTAMDDRAGLFFSIAFDLQFLLGLLLYFVYSPYTALAMDDFGAAMRSSDLRFWAVEHVFGALVGLTLVHIGRVRIRKATDAVKRHRLAAIFFGLAFLAILISIPWPGTPNARPLIPR